MSWLQELLVVVSTWQAQPIPELPADWPQLVHPLDPLGAAVLVDAAFADVPPGFVRDTCLLESSCYASRLVGVHELDVAMSRPAWERAVLSGRLDPETCEHHAYREDQWSTRGAHGLMAAFNLRWLGRCLPPEVLDVPIYSALAAGRKARHLCRVLKRRGKRCTRLRLRCLWGMRKLGTRSCGRAIRRWKRRLRRYKANRTSIEWDRVPRTVAEFRRTWARNADG